MNFYYQNVINVFTDASLIKDASGISSVCAGHVITLNGAILNYNADIFYDTNSSYGEIYALYNGLKIAIDINREKFYSKYQINIFSDNEFAVMGCTTWLNNWYEQGRNEFVLTNNSKKTVAYQEVFLDIIKLVVDNGIPIKILNVLAHKKPNNSNSMNEFSNYFYSKNIVPRCLTDKQLKEICSFNNIVDNMTRSTLNKVLNNNFNMEFYRRKRMPCIYWFPHPEEIKYYLKLVNS